MGPAPTCRHCSKHLSWLDSLIPGHNPMALVLLPAPHFTDEEMEASWHPQGLSLQASGTPHPQNKDDKILIQFLIKLNTELSFNQAMTWHLEK